MTAPDASAMVAGVLVADGSLDGVVTSVRCVVDSAVTASTLRELCWVDPVTGFTLVLHRFNEWCCVPLDTALAVPASSNGNPLGWSNYAPADRIGTSVALAGVLLVATLVAFVAAVLTSPRNTNDRPPDLLQVRTVAVGNSDHGSRTHR